MDANQRESDTLDKDIVDFGVHEDVVNEQLAHLNVRNGRRVAAGIVVVLSGANVLEQLTGAGKLNINETLTVRDTPGRDGQTGILVKPEEQRHPHVDGGLHLLRGLRTITDVDLLTDTSTTARTRVNESTLSDFLSGVLVPSKLLVRGHEELLVHVMHIRVILIQRVSVHGKLNVLDELLAGTINVAHKASGIISIISSDLSQADMENHIVEEVTELRNGELNLLSESSRSGLHTDLVVLITDCGERLKVSVHEQNMRTLDIH
jgi:hypothetical protein